MKCYIKIFSLESLADLYREGKINCIRNSCYSKEGFTLYPNMQIYCGKILKAEKVAIGLYHSLGEASGIGWFPWMVEKEYNPLEYMLLFLRKKNEL